MVDPHWWLWVVRHGEKICGWAGAGTLIWLLLFMQFWPEAEGRAGALAFFIVLSFVAVGGSTVTWAVKQHFLTIIDDRRSERDWEKIREGRWPSD